MTEEHLETHDLIEQRLGQVILGWLKAESPSEKQVDLAMKWLERNEPKRQQAAEQAPIEAAIEAARRKRSKLPELDTESDDPATR